jgi:hypothetical protein
MILPTPARWFAVPSNQASLGITKTLHRRQSMMARCLTLEVLEARVLPSFVAPLSFDVGTSPRAVAVGDFNGDGVLDLAVANATINGTVSVLLGNGDGSFQPAHNFAAGDDPISVAVGDFNGDGVPDLAVADNASFGGTPGISVLLGNGDGSFQAARHFDAGANPRSVAIGDFNGDGVPDLVVANDGSNDVSVLLGNGDGSFQPARSFAAGNVPLSVAVGDFNGDGIDDLAVANSQSNDVSVLLGNGDGSFQPARNYAAGTHPFGLAVGDFTGDGISDLAVTNYTTLGSVSVLLGNGDGTFQAPVSYATGDHSQAGDNSSSVVIGDFTGDGIPDLAVANDSSTGPVSVLLGNGDGTFQPARNFLGGSGSQALAAGDFTGDGTLDLAVANLSGNVSVLLGNGDGTFPAAANFVLGISPQSVAVGDFNGDGIPDLAAANLGSNNVSVLLGNGGGMFQPAVNYAAGLAPTSVVVADLTGDGIPDLVVTNDTTYVSVLLGNGDGTCQPPQTYAAGNAAWSVAVGDFNGDGIPDLVVANLGSDSVSVLLGNGDGSFQAPRNFAVGHRPRSVAVGDFNGDGVLDLAVADSGNVDGSGSGVSVLLGNGDGSFQPARTFAAGTNPFSVAVGDLDGSGKLDLVVADNATYGGTPGISVLLGNGNGTFQPARTYAAGSRPSSVAVGDFNGDGIPDLAVAGGAGTRVLLGNGDGSFQTTNVSYITGISTSVAIGDFNGDGLLDLAVTDAPANRVFLLANDGSWGGPAPQHRRAAARNGSSSASIPVSAQAPDPRGTNLDRSPDPLASWRGEAIGAVEASGATFPITSFAVDTPANTASTYHDTVHFSSTDPSVQLPTDYAFAPADGGAQTYVARLATPRLQTTSIRHINNAAPSFDLSVFVDNGLQTRAG